MKKLFHVTLLVCFGLASFAQSWIPPGRIATEAYVKKYVDSVLSIRPPVVVLPPFQPPVIVGPILLPCEAGPDIRSITNITGQSLTLVFHGKKVLGLDFQILKDGSTQRSGKITPTSNTLTVGYESLSAGTYTFRLAGNTCLGASTREFVIEKRTGSVNPPKIPDGGRPDQSVQPVLMSRSWPGILDVQITGTSNDWRITDASPFALRDGYEWQYLINAEIVRISRPLSNHSYQGNTPVRIQKQAIKRGVAGLNRWDSEATSEGWFSRDASYTFGPIADVGGVTSYYFQGGWQPQSGDLAWVNPVPAAWVPKDYSSWPEVSPAITLPPNKVYVQQPHAEGQTMAQLLSLGVTHYPHGMRNEEPNLPLDRQYHDATVERVLLNMRQENGQWVKSYTDDHIRDAARRIGTFPIAIHETMEGNGWIPQYDRQWGVFYDEKARTVPRDGKRRYLAHNYYDILPGEYSTTNKALTSMRWVYNTPARNLPRGAFNGTLKNTNTHVTGWYKNAPDENDYTYKRLYNMQVSKRLSLFTGTFTFPVHEWAPGFSWQVNTTNPAGQLSQSDKAPLPPSELIAAAFLGLDEGDIAIMWDTDRQRSRSPNDAIVGWMGNKTIWQPAPGSPANFPFKTSGSTFPGYPQWGYDIFHFGILLYHFTSAQTDGGESRYADFRLDNGPWITAQPDGSDVLDAWNDKRGLAKVSRKGNLITVSYMNPFADNAQHLIEVRNPFSASQTWQGRVFGDIIHAVNLSL